jgi:hypothetical protein
MAYILAAIGFITVSSFAYVDGKKTNDNDIKDTVYQIRGEIRKESSKPVKCVKPKNKNIRGNKYYIQKKKSTREQRCRNILEAVFKMPFNSKKPEWLINPKTGRRLELDCYNRQLRLAIEVDGAQHHHYIPHFHKCYQKFEDMKERDLTKSMICKKRGVRLIRIPYHIEENSLEEFILYEAGKAMKS